MTLRIAFAGASGTGKTSLARPLAEALSLELQPSFARAVAADMGFASPYDVDAAGLRNDYQRRVMDRLLAWQIARHAVGYVTDRTCWDAYAYTAMHADADTTAAVLSGILRASHGLGVPDLRLYTHVFLCPIASFHHVGDDPARVQDRAYHLEFERVLRLFMDSASVPYDLSLIRIPARTGRAQWLKDLIASLSASSSAP